MGRVDWDEAAIVVKQLVVLDALAWHEASAPDSDMSQVGRNVEACHQVYLSASLRWI